MIIKGVIRFVTLVIICTTGLFAGFALLVYGETLEECMVRSIALAGKGDFSETILCLTRAAEACPNNPLIYNNRGIAYSSKESFDKAINDFNKALEIKPNSASVYNNRGLTYAKKGDYELAETDFSKAIGIDPGNILALNNRGIIRMRKGNLDLAVSDFTKTIEISPSFAQAYSNRAIAYFLKEEYEKSWQDVHSLERLPYKINPEFIEKLKSTTGRNVLNKQK